MTYNVFGGTLNLAQSNQCICICSVMWLLTIVAEDKKLPSVRPIRVTLPENYPQNSPTCNTLSEDSGE